MTTLGPHQGAPADEASALSDALDEVTETIWEARGQGVALQRARQLPKPLQNLARHALSAAGWRAYGGGNVPRRAIIIAGPHTSGVDLFVMVAGAWSRGVRPRFLVKQSLMRPPLGLLMAALGAVGVNRAQANGLVAQVARRLADGEGPFALLPSGTRQAGPWKRGFLHMARASGAPLYLMTCNYRTKELYFFGPLVVQNDSEAEEARVMGWVRGAMHGVTGRHPKGDDVLELEARRPPA